MLSGLPVTLAPPGSVVSTNDEDRFRRLIAGLNVGVVVQRPNSEILIVNPMALELLGLTESQILGMTSFDPYWKIVGEDGSDFPASERPIAAVVRTNAPVRNVVMGVHRPKTKDVTWLLVDATPEFASDGQITQIVATLGNITEVKRLQTSLLEARKLESIGRLAGGIAHDFNNLLTVIIGSTSLALNLMPEDAAGRADLEQSMHAAERAASLTRQLLTFARRQVTVPQCVKPAEALRAIEPLLSRLIGEDIKLSISAREDTWLVQIDPVELEQVIVNLAVNARDAMPNGGRLTIDTANVEVDLPAGQFAVIKVTDTGCGMDAGTRDRLFEPFFSTKELGTGLGLATVHGIVEKQGGFITVQSEPGRGASFLVNLKRAEVGATPVTTSPGSATETASPVPGHATILVVEDEPLIRSLARRVLEMSGHRVLVAEHGLEALKVAREHTGPIDVVVTDIVMPELDGTRAAAELMLSRPNLSVIFTSGYTEQQRTFVGGCFLSKPYTPSQLVERVQAVIAEQRGNSAH